MDIHLDDNGNISAIAHETEACILAQASAALLGQTAQGHNQAQMEALRGQITARLKQQTPLPPGPFSDYESFAGAASYASRHKCVLLPLDALLDALKAPIEL